MFTSGPLIAKLLKVSSHRTVTVTGGLLCSGGLIVIGFTDHIALVYLGYGLSGR